MGGIFDIARDDATKLELGRRRVADEEKEELRF